jgi:hypothetical protein
MFYWLSNNNQTDQGDETEGLDFVEGRIREGEIAEVVEGGCKGIVLCLSQIGETIRC